ncbi:hypothetical protein LJ207_00255 [Halanaerobium sp. Z-7514]|uniref:Uncharacterized protein n=1 Tax=Halanaerobium polyolivorans TaxID=2886943 RepID=A0AAW4WRM1_9FIRM|nr:hypothetical protein [Halanaerobium polyolivorans]MCC3143757.1 hypothetical protein [Halanaerobium polyolivorans]
MIKMAVKIKKKELLLVLITILIILIGVNIFNNIRQRPAENAINIERESEEKEAELKVPDQAETEEQSSKMIASLDELQDPFFAQSLDSEAEQKAAVKETDLLSFRDDFYYEENLSQEVFLEPIRDEQIKQAEKRIEQITIPFKLQGIIKDKNYSLAFFEYQNNIFEKREGEKLAGFMIEKIGVKKVEISLEDFRAKLSVWGDKQVE